MVMKPMEKVEFKYYTFLRGRYAQLADAKLSNFLFIQYGRQLSRFAFLT